MHRVSTINPENEFQNKFGIQSKNLSSIIRGVKSAVTIYAKNMEIDFEWQPRFYDHVIRTESKLIRIRKYIIENPQKWKNDSHNSHFLK